RANFLKRLLRPAKKICPRQRLQKLATQIQRRRFLYRELNLQQPLRPVELPMLPPVIARRMHQRKPKLPQQIEIAQNGLRRHPGSPRQFAQRRSLPPRAQRSKQGPLSEERWLIGHEYRNQEVAPWPSLTSPILLPT